MTDIIKFFDRISNSISFGEPPYDVTAVTYRGAMNVAGSAKSIEGPVTLYLTIKTVQNQRVAGIKLGEFETPKEIGYLGLAIDVAPEQDGRNLVLQYDTTDNPEAKELIQMLQHPVLFR